MSQHVWAPSRMSNHIWALKGYHISSGPQTGCRIISGPHPAPSRMSNRNPARSGCRIHLAPNPTSSCDKPWARKLGAAWSYIWAPFGICRITSGPHHGMSNHQLRQYHGNLSRFRVLWVAGRESVRPPRETLCAFVRKRQTTPGPHQKCRLISGPHHGCRTTSGL